jgi:hypothetical protein
MAFLNWRYAQFADIGSVFTTRSFAYDLELTPIAVFQSLKWAILQCCGIKARERRLALICKHKARGHWNRTAKQ